MFRRAALLAAIAFSALTAVPARAETLGRDVVLTGNIQQTIDSRTSNVGDRFTILLTNPLPTSTLAGARLSGRIVSLRRAGQGTNPYINLAFDRITLANGRSYPISAEVLQDQIVRDNRNAGRMIATTGGAALLGGLLGNGTGAAIGGAAGLIFSSNFRDNVQIPAGSQMRVLTTLPTTI